MWDFALKNALPSFFRIAFDQGASVADYMDNNNGSFKWNVRFARSVQD